MAGGPFSLANYLSYGTLSVLLVPEAIEKLHWPDQILAEDGWTVFTLHPIIKYLETPEDDTILHELESLMLQQFIFASYSLSGDWCTIRIYLIPWDLPGVQGKLRVRKENIVKPARRSLINFLPQISRSRECWEGRAPAEPPSVPAGTTLSGIYEDLPSPQALVTAASTPVTRRLLDFSDDLENLGLRSTLHRYQRRSVAAIVQQEMDLSDNPDPLFIPVVGINNEELFIQPGTMEVLLERPLVAPCRGGILCEELGTGKTVMILALVLATLNQLSEPAPSIIDTRPVLTPLAFRHFPSSEFETARARVFRNKHPFGTSTVPTLVELLLHKMATSPVVFTPESRAQYHANIKEDLENLEHYTGPRKDNLPFYLEYQNEPTNNERKNKRTAPAQVPRQLYLTSATLIVVPPNLLRQWQDECSLHCEDSLRVCVIQGNAPIPPARILAADYDIILLTYSRFTAEEKRGESAWRSCTCAEYPNVRVPKCVCKPPAGSPLLQIRWKRLVIDEGHVSASLSTILTPFTKKLSVERRWIVSGTPTTNLLGLNLGKTTSAPPSEDGEPPSRGRSESPEVNTPSVVDSPPVTRVWNRDDGEDLEKLGKMITHFVGVPQLLANPQLISTHIKEPLLDRRGPRTGAIDVLMQLMSSVMIRHRIADVEEEVILPPVTQELILLDLDPLVVKSYNAMQAGIAINAVTSERKDQDYMFHPRNADALQQTVTNMSQLMFWAIDENIFNADEQLRDSGKGVKKGLNASTSPEDVKLVNDALHHLEVAASDPLWRTLHTHEDVLYQVYGLKQTIFEAWSRTPHSVDSGDPLLAGYIHPDRLRALRNKVVGQPLLSEKSLIEEGHNVAERDAKQRKAYEESLKRKKGKESSSQLKATQAAKNAAAPSTLKAVKDELEQVRAAEFDTPAPDRGHISRPSALVSTSYIGKTWLGSSASSKLNYIINEVLEYSPTEKFLIFSDSELSLAHIAEALELVGVDSLRFTTQTTAQVREQFVLTFKTSERYRVFLMELKHGARGLNLTSASRVIFCEPVWRADVESQAIKRCHRIGQTRPITVKTLAIRETAEQNMAARRLALKDSQEKIPKLIQENGMRAFIANPKFLTHTPTILPTIKVPLVKLAPKVDEDSSFADVGGPSSSAPRRWVRFADSDDDNEEPTSKRKLPPPGDDDLQERPKKVRLIVPDPVPRDSPPKKKSKSRATVRFAEP
ncbi:P-loop containing nucleoside triphosphate hydrolase protein [Mycena epipterygia]|nr:P-loop containing nucleoside triphosphate hydrolase protein [Mycena epipterygia]